MNFNQGKKNKKCKFMHISALFLNMINKIRSFLRKSNFFKILFLMNKQFTAYNSTEFISILKAYIS